MYCHIIYSIMIMGREMATDLFGPFCNCIEVALESVHDSPFGLGNILFASSIACNTVYHLVWFTGDIFHGVKLSAMMAADNVPTGVNFRTIQAIFVFCKYLMTGREVFSIVA